MNHKSGHFKYAILTSIALSLTLSACSSSGSGEQASPAPTVSATETTTATPAPTETVTPQPTTPVITEAVTTPVVPVPVPEPAPSNTPKPAVPTLATFTFPDGHISFRHPANWTVKTAQGRYLDYDKETDKAKSVEAHIFDETGNEVALVASGGYGGGAAGPVSRVVLDSQTLPAFPNRDGEVGFGFVMDYSSPDGVTSYFMAVMDDQFLTEGAGKSSPSSVLLAPNGAAAAQVTFSTPAFKSPAAAKAWMGTQQYSQLRAMLTSLQYV